MKPNLSIGWHQRETPLAGRKLNGSIPDGVSPRTVSTQVHLVALDIFTGKKYEDICPSTHNMEVPVVKRKDYQLCDIGDDGFCDIMDLDTCDQRNDVKLPDGDVGDKIREAFEKDESGILVSPPLPLLSSSTQH